jgi:type IV secretion system protein VirD4
VSTLTGFELVAALGLSLASWLSFRRKDVGAGAFTGGLALATLFAASFWLMLLVVVGLGVTLYFRWNRSADMVRRWGRKSRRKHGVASTFDIVRRTWLSKGSIRAKASVVRPSLAELSRWRRLRVPLVQFSVEMCRSGWLRVWSSIEDVVLVLGGPRRGKSGWAAGRILDAAGACVVTSTRTDLYDRTAHLRSKHGPTYVFNAAGLGGRPSTITFDVLTDCADPTSAMERASDLLMLSSDQDGEGSRWDRQSRRVLGAFLHAAALGDRPSSAVLRWVARPDDSKREVMSLLRRSPVPEFVEDALQFLDTNDRTRSSITSGIMPALAWLMAPASAAAAAPSETPFDVRRLLRERGTVYMLGAEESHTAPLLAALTGYIAREARKIAAEQIDGRLDPNLTFVLDEIVLSAPIPLPKWVADMGGRGVTIIALAQSLSQLHERWGEQGTATILDNAGSIMIFGGTKDPKSLSTWLTLLGNRDEDVASKDAGGRVSGYSQRSTPVISAAQLSNLPAFRVLLLQTGLPPLVGRARMVWQRADVKAAVRAERMAARAAVAEAEAVTAGVPLGDAPVEPAVVAQLPAPRRWAVGSGGPSTTVAQPPADSGEGSGRRARWAAVLSRLGGRR